MSVTPLSDGLGFHVLISYIMKIAQESVPDIYLLWRFKVFSTPQIKRQINAILLYSASHPPASAKRHRGGLRHKDKE